MQFLTHNWQGFFTTLPVFLLGCVALYFFWWKRLPSPDEVVADFVTVPPRKQAERTVEEVETVAAP